MASECKINMDGLNDQITRTDAEGLTEINLDLMTISMKMTQGTTGNNQCFASRELSSGQGWIMTQEAQGTYFFSVDGDGGGYSGSEILRSTSTPSPGDELTIVLYINQSDIRMYINGVQEDTNSRTNKVLNLGDLHIGRRGQAIQFFDGKVHSFKIWDVALGPSDIVDDHAGLDVNPSSVVLDWQMNDESGTTIADSSGNGYDGTLSGGVWECTQISVPVSGTNFNDLRRNFFNANTSGTFVNAWDAERNALIEKTSRTSGHITDLWKVYFKSLGYDSYNLHIADVWYMYLGDQGYVGSLRERQRAYFQNGVME